MKDLRRKAPKSKNASRDAGATGSDDNLTWNQVYMRDNICQGQSDRTGKDREGQTRMSVPPGARGRDPVRASAGSSADPAVVADLAA